MGGGLSRLKVTVEHVLIRARTLSLKENIMMRNKFILNVKNPNNVQIYADAV